MTDPTHDFWDGRTVMVTGGSGFLGSHLIEDLEDRSDDVQIFVPRSDDYDLREKADIERAFEDSGADTVIHLAATVGGIGANKENPGRYFYDNAIMGIELLEQARQFEVDKFTILGTICSYPKHTEVPFKEEDLYDGYPEETNAPYGIAKKALLTQSRAYRKQYDFDSIYLMPVNLYGPRDDFDLETSHVIPAIIRKSIEARENDEDAITAWGTGEPTREFLYVEDAAEGILDATERYDSSDPVNLGSGHEISIRDLVELIVELTDFDGDVEWDTSKPDGQPRRKLDTSRARERFGWEASTDFEEGLEKTIEWYEANRGR
ncbi:GDP-L-fucose synthase family protein [Halanaeroarchaeum sulfurireducens]|uniref:GDP-L-fucose synthase n=1 Tax=Halanaeroarchaeum sulfurireducens TaxID=1604004 RepID=A0A0F7PB99_9EURY|nr:GDP-L-fucose synthase [Halanaeroarchaeum sulfurireducens]AKH97430.1 UDP-glucose 4-epimerase [Halanaeroarchaeum sulfurireducens]ALG81826.1 UDP-glucose 4-epimerase [Halanaeroarchaeum sulfurireducens]